MQELWQDSVSGGDAGVGRRPRLGSGRSHWLGKRWAPSGGEERLAEDGHREQSHFRSWAGDGNSHRKEGFADKPNPPVSALSEECHGKA